MNKNYLKKRILTAVTIVSLVLLRFFLRLYKLIFTKRTILFVTNHKIRSISFTPLTQICVALFFAWVLTIFNQSLHFNQIINAKSDEVDRLKTMNTYFQGEFRSMSEKLRKVNDYLISVTGSDTQKVNSEEIEKVQPPKGIDKEELSDEEQQTLNDINDADTILAGIHSTARDRINVIENAINLTGLNLKNSRLQHTSEKEVSLNKNGITNHQGGPLRELESIITNSSTEEDFDVKWKKSQFSNDIERLAMLEDLARSMPLSRPMKNYYISSGFGDRTDPILGMHAVHKGLDFVGADHAKIISPSKGKVVLAGQFSDYGNAIVIDHGFGITTRYGHLSSVNVIEGQTVKKGQIIATQGSTGRSTGSHLHYEVRYKNTPLNPKKFLEAGDALFKDEKTVKYVNS